MYCIGPGNIKLFVAILRLVNGLGVLWDVEPAPYATVSLGVSSLRHEDDATATQMVKRADDALYHAKNSG